MKLTSFSLFIALFCILLVSTLVHAQTLPQHAISAEIYANKMIVQPSCQKAPLNEFSPGLQMKMGKYKGQCLDTSNKRAVAILDESTDGITFANFKHHSRFWTAKLKWSSVDSLEYIIVDLPSKIPNKLGVLISHAELRFKLKKDQPIVLESLDANKEVTSVDDFLISFNYMAPTGVPYDALKGFDSSLYQAAFQVFSMEDEVQIRFRLSPVNVYSLKLTTSPEQGRLILRNALWRSHQSQYTANYDTWNKNCITELFKVVDGAISKTYQSPVKKFKFHWYKISDTGFEPAVEALQERKLLAQKVKLNLVNSEFGFPRYKGNLYE